MQKPKTKVLGFGLVLLLLSVGLIVQFLVPPLWLTVVLVAVFLLGAPFLKWWVQASGMPQSTHKPKADPTSTGLLTLDPNSHDLIFTRIHPGPLRRNIGVRLDYTTMGGGPITGGNGLASIYLASSHPPVRHGLSSWKIHSQPEALSVVTGLVKAYDEDRRQLIVRAHEDMISRIHQSGSLADYIAAQEAIFGVLIIDTDTGAELAEMSREYFVEQLQKASG